MNAPQYITAARVASATGLSVTDIYRAHSEAMGSPRHFLMIQGVTVYTPEGLGLLAESFERQGWPGEGAAIRRLVIAHEERKAWYQEGAMA